MEVPGSQENGQGNGQNHHCQGDHRPLGQRSADQGPVFRRRFPTDCQGQDHQCAQKDAVYGGVQLPNAGFSSGEQILQIQPCQGVQEGCQGHGAGQTGQDLAPYRQGLLGGRCRRGGFCRRWRNGLRLGGQAATASDNHFRGGNGFWQKCAGHAAGGGGIEAQAGKEGKRRVLCRNAAVKEQGAPVPVSGAELHVVADQNDAHALAG